MIISYPDVVITALMKPYKSQAELGRLNDAGSDERSNRIENLRDTIRVGLVNHTTCTTEVSKMDDQSLAHSRYNCTYHIVFIPKYRRKAMFGALRREVGEILGKVCKMEEVTIVKAATMPDHVHMYVSIPPKVSISKTIGRIKGKRALMIFDRHPE